MSGNGFWTPLWGLWLACCLVQLYYWLRVFYPLSWAQTPTGNTQDPVSVIICIHEVTPQFGDLLAALAQQDYPAYEVLIVNDGGNPEISKIIASGSDAAVLEIVLSPEDKTHPGKKEALALGIREARYHWLLLTDADCSVQKQWISQMMACTSPEKQIVLGYGPFMRHNGFTQALARFDNLMIAMQYLGHAHAGHPYMGVGRNLLYHKSLFEGSMGFEKHDDLASGDDDLFVQDVANGSNTTICLTLASFAVSPAKSTLKDLLLQKQRHVSTAPRYALRAQMQLALFGASFAAWWLGALLIAAFSSSQTFLLIAGVTVLVQWFVFASLTRKLDVRGIAGWFVPLSVVYPFFLMALSLLMLIGPPRTWKRS